MNHDAQIEEICREVFGKQPVLIKDFFSLSNFIYYIEFSEEEKYVLKIFNLEADNIFLFDQKKTEEVLRESKFYTSLIYKETPNWCIEHFIKGETLEVEHHRSQQHRKMYMKRISEYHKLAMRKDIKEHIIHRLWSFKPKIYSKIRENIKDHPQKAEIEEILFQFEEFYNKVFRNFQTDEKLVFVHNDLLYGNWLYDKKDKRFQLIDFEYTGFGFFMTDIYNIMIESIYDYRDEGSSWYIRHEEYLPNADEIKELIRYYLFFEKYGDEYYSQTDELEHLKQIEDDQRLKQISQEEIDKYYDNIDLYGSICNLYWTLWAFYIYYKPDRNIDYVPYGLDRYKDFCRNASKLKKFGNI